MPWERVDAGGALVWVPTETPASLTWNSVDGAGTTTWGSVIEVPVVQVQGENGPRLKVDQHGQARTILYGPNGQPLMTEDNPMYVVVQGKDGSTPVPVKVDSQGRLVLADVNVSVGDVTVDVGVIKQGAKDSTAEPWEFALTGSTALSKAGLGANVTQNKANAARGLNHALGSSGTDLAANEATTVLNVSGFGRIHHIVVATNHHSAVRAEIALDGTSLGPQLYDRAENLATIQGGSSVTVGRDRAIGPVYLLRYDTSGNRYVWAYDGWTLGAFGSGAVITLRNASPTTAYSGYMGVFYAVGSSERLTYQASESIDAASVHTALVDTLERQRDEFTVVVAADEETYRLEVYVRGHFDDGVRGQIEDVLAGFGVEV